MSSSSPDVAEASTISLYPRRQAPANPSLWTGARGISAHELLGYHCLRSRQPYMAIWGGGGAEKGIMISQGLYLRNVE